MPNSLAIILNKASHWLFLGVIFLVPITVLPWTYDPYDFNKLVVTVVGVLLAAVCLLVSKLLHQDAVRRPSLILLLPLLFLAVTAMSAALSLSPVVSWLGQGGQEYASVLSLVVFLGVFYLGHEFFQHPHWLGAGLIAALAGSAVVGCVSLTLFFGLDLGVLGGLAGVPHALGFYLVTMTLLGLSLSLVGEAPLRRIVTSQRSRWALGICLWVTFVSTLLVLLALDSLSLWILVLLGVTAIFAAALLHAERFLQPTKFLPLMVLFVLAFVFAFLPTRLKSPFLPEVSPNLTATWGIAQGAWSDGSIFLGTGPGTFALNYSKYVTLDVNQTDFWGVIFDRGNSQVMTMLATHGLAGTLTWLFFVIAFLTLGIRRIYEGAEGWTRVLPVLVAWLTVVLAAFLYTQNFTLAFTFWLLSAMLAALLIPSSEVAAMSPARARFVSIVFTIMVLVLTVMAFYLTGNRYVADVVFAKALKHSADADTPEEVDEIVRLLDKAANINVWNDTYYRNLAGILLRKLSLLTPEQTADDEYIQSVLKATIASANQATDLSPYNVLNWEVEGMVYRDLLSVVPDGARPSIHAYEQAIELAPINPAHRVEIARTYLAVADAQTPMLNNSDRDLSTQAAETKAESLAKAEEHLNTAVALKADYAPAWYYSALLKERQGKLAEAVAGLVKVRDSYPEDVGVGLQLSLLYLRQGKNDLARAELERILEISPAYANAHWYLSVVYEQQGNLPAAISEVEQVLATNGDNVTVQTRLERLQQGLTTENIPEPLVTPAP